MIVMRKKASAMWKNFKREYQIDVQRVSQVPTRVAKIRTDRFVEGLVKTCPSLSSDILKCLHDFDNTCLQAKFSPVVLGEGNADWIAISLISGATSSPIAQRVLVDFMKEGALLNNMAVKETNQRIFESFLPCHMVTYGRGDDVAKLFEECIKLASVLDTKVATVEVVRELDRRLNRQMEVHVAAFPRGVRCPLFRKTHNLNLNPPKKHGKYYSADLTRVLSVPNTGRLRVDMSQKAGYVDTWVCDFSIPVNVVDDGYVLGYELTVAQLLCRTNHNETLRIMKIPSPLGDVPMLPWLEYCKLLTLRRRGVPAMGVVSVFILFHLWHTLDAPRLREIMVMLRSRQKNEVTDCILDVFAHFDMEREEWSVAIQKTWRCMMMVADSIAANFTFRNDDNFAVTYISPITMR